MRSVVAFFGSKLDFVTRSSLRRICFPRRIQHVYGFFRAGMKTFVGEKKLRPLCKIKLQTMRFVEEEEEQANEGRCSC